MASPGALGAEPRLRHLLERLDTAADAGSAPAGGAADAADAGSTGGSAGTVDRGQHRADELLARIAWCRLAEPGDGVAGALVGLLGAGRMLELLSGPQSAAEIRAAADARGVALSGAVLSAAVKRWQPRLDRSATVRDIERGSEAGLTVVSPGDPLWPAQLDDLGAHAPIMLWVRGDPALLSACGLAVVGARAASGYGNHVTAELVDGVSARGAVIVSGAAYGIDAVAHRTALAAGTGTVAVLAGGADRPYPAGNRSLIERIGTEGAVCSELVPGLAPTRWRFLQRNRIIATLAAATLVTEAGTRSGTLNTAGHAAEIGRPLGAVPGPITSTTSAGCHRLLREYGAVLVTSAAEACELIGAELEAVDPLLREERAAGAGGEQRGEGADAHPSARAPSLHRRLLDALPLRGSRTLPEISRLAGVSAGEARGGLAELELLGHVGRRETPEREEAGWALLRRE